MGKRKIEIKKIKDQNKKQVAFSKRRKGLFGKADKFCKDFGANIGIIVFSPAGKPFTFGSIDIDAMVDKYLSDESRLSEPVCSSSEQLEEKQISMQLEKKQNSEPVEEKQDEGPSMHTISDNLAYGPVHSIASTNGRDVTVWNLESDDIDWSLCAPLGDVPTVFEDNDDSYVKSLLPPLICSNDQLEDKQISPLIGSNEPLEEKQVGDPCTHTNASTIGCDDTDWSMKGSLVIPSDFGSDEHDRYLESFADDMLAGQNDAYERLLESFFVDNKLADQNDEYERLLESFFADGALADQNDYTFPFPANPLPREIVQC